MARKPRFTTRFAVDVLEGFQAVKSDMHLQGRLSDNACLAQLIETYRAPREIDVDTQIQLLRCSAEEIDAINATLSVEYADIWDMLKEGLLLVVGRRNQYLSSDNNLQDAQTRKARQTGGYEHVAFTVARLMQDNQHAEHTFQQIYLSVGMVVKIARVHEQTVRQYFAEHQDAIDAHNHNVLGIMSEEHGKRHNLLRAKWLQAEQKGNGAQFLARYGMRLVTPNGSLTPPQNTEELAL